MRTFEGASATNPLSTWTCDPQPPAALAGRHGSSISWSYAPAGRPASQADSFGGGAGNVTALSGRGVSRDGALMPGC